MAAEKNDYQNVDWSETAGAKLYRHAKKRIPGGTQLLSKRPEMYLPDLWPSYYSKCKGCEVWDMDGRRFVDMSTMGIGACLLGYANDDVNAAVKQAVDNGSMCTLNAPAEVELADLLCEIHPWADMARYARTGGETMAVAVRIARARTGRDKICICGYHGWSDWYVAANVGDNDALDGHLLKGIPAAGVPKGLAGTILPFHYNQIEELEAHAKRNGNEIAAIVMEPMRYDFPTDGFLDKVRELATRIGAVLVFDEITIGLRAVTSGMHLKLGVEPDIACFAKSISNGYPMGVILGRENVMQAAQKSFISSTYWTEAIGPTAALATLRTMQRVDLPSHVKRIGTRTMAEIDELARKHGMKMHTGGLPVLQHIAFEYGDMSKAMMTLLTQLLLDRGFLAGGAFYPTLGHDDQAVSDYLAALDEVLPILKEAVENHKVEAMLQGPVAHAGFQRLT